STDVQLSAEMLSWSRSKGLFAGIALHGATMRPDNDVNGDFAGNKLTKKKTRTGDVKPPAAAMDLIHALNRYSPHEEKDTPVESRAVDKPKQQLSSRLQRRGGPGWVRPAGCRVGAAECRMFLRDGNPC